MGVQGLTSFMNGTILDDVLEEIKLRDTRLLVDAFSLLHKINNGIYCLQSTFGGNYDEMGKKLESLFDTFKRCNIQPVFLFDGGRDKHDRKFQTSLKRAKSKLSDSMFLNACATSKNGSLKVNINQLINSGNYRVFGNLLPVLAYKVFIKLIKKYEFEIYQCYFEADYELALLANQFLHCPLLSSDSDFLIFDLLYGYIPINCLDINPEFEAENEERPYLPARIYKLDKFIDYYNTNICDYEGLSLRKELLPIFAILCGNDFVDRSVFSSLLATFDSSNNNMTRRALARRGRSRKALRNSKNAHFFHLLDWLVQFQDVDDCVTTMLKFIKLDKHQLVRKCVEDATSDYLCKKPFESKYLTKLVGKEGVDDGSNDVLVISDNLIASQLFVHKYQKCELNRLCLDVLVHSRVILNCQIEIMERPSSYLSSAHIRKLFYSVLYNSYTTKKPDDSVIVKEYLRVGKDIKIYDVEIDPNESIQSLATNQVRLISKIFLPEFDEATARHVSDFPLVNELKFYFLVLFLWLKNNNDNSNYKSAFIVSLIKTLIIEPSYCLSKSVTHSESLSIKVYEQDEFIDSFGKQDLNVSVKQFESYLKSAENCEYLKELRTKLLSSFCPSLSDNGISKSDRHMNLKVLHAMSEYQAIHLSVSFLFETLFDQTPLIGLESFFNGSFLHSFTEELQRRVNPSLYIEELLGRRSIFKQLYIKLVDLYNQLFASNFC